MNVYEVIRRPLITEKGQDKKDNERTLVFEVAAEAAHVALAHAEARPIVASVSSQPTASDQGGSASSSVRTASRRACQSAP